MCKDEEGAVYKRRKLESVITDFIVVECGIRKLAPNSVIKNYLPGIAATFDEVKEDSAEDFRKAINAREVKLVASGFMRQFDKETSGFMRQFDKENPVASRVKLPFRMNLAVRSKDVMKSQNAFNGPHADILRKRVYVATTVGIQFC